MNSHLRFADLCYLPTHHWQAQQDYVRRWGRQVLRAMGLTEPDVRDRDEDLWLEALELAVHQPKGCITLYQELMQHAVAVWGEGSAEL